MSEERETETHIGKVVEWLWITVKVGDVEHRRRIRQIREVFMETGIDS